MGAAGAPRGGFFERTTAPQDARPLPAANEPARLALRNASVLAHPPPYEQDTSDPPGGGSRSGVTFGRHAGGSGGGSRSKSGYGGSGGGSNRSNNNNNNSNNNNNHDDDGRPSLASLGAALRRQAEDAALKVVTLQRSGVGMVTLLRKIEAAVHALSTKDLFWKVCGRKSLRAHALVFVGVSVCVSFVSLFRTDRPIIAVVADTERKTLVMCVFSYPARTKHTLVRSV